MDPVNEFEERINYELTGAERMLKLVIIVSSLAYILVAFLFLFYPDAVFYVFNEAGALANGILKGLTDFKFYELKFVEHKFWLRLSFAMLVMIAICGFIAQVDIRKNIKFVIPVLLFKIASTALLTIIFVVSACKGKENIYFAYVGNALIEGVLLLIIGISFFLAGKSYKSASILESLKYFTPNQYAIMAALANAIIPQKGGIKFSAGDLESSKKVDKFLYHGSSFMRKMFPLLLLLFEYGTNIFHRPFSQFTKLSIEDQAQYINGWHYSKWKLKKVIFAALKTVVMQGYYFDERVWKEIGYAGPWSKSTRDW